MARNYLLKKLDDGEFRTKIAKTISDKIDIPKVQEKHEYRLSLAIVDAVVDYVKGLK